MPKLNSGLPKYRRHLASGQAVVTLSGKDHYLGPFGSKASKINYDLVTSTWLAAGRRLTTGVHDITVAELLAKYWEFATQHYKKDGQPTHEIVNVKCAIRPLKVLYGRTSVRDFGPLKLKAIQNLLVGGYTDDKGKARAGIARPTVNARIGAIKRIFAWAVSEELAPASTAHALAAVRGLQRGRTEAREPAPIEPVDDATIEATLVHLPAVVANMVRFQRLVGCRPGEVCGLRPGDIDRSLPVWIYRPSDHKMKHNDRQRLIFIGPRAQEILRLYLLRDAEAFCFSPAESEQKRKLAMRANRQSKVQPSQFDRSKSQPKANPGRRYLKDSYTRAIHRACDCAFPAPDGLAGDAETVWRKSHRWSPNQLRHAAATEIRRRFGLEAAQVVLGHSRADVTQIYAERDFGLAARVTAEVG